MNDELQTKLNQLLWLLQTSGAITDERISSEQTKYSCQAACEVLEQTGISGCDIESLETTLFFSPSVSSECKLLLILAICQKEKATGNRQSHSSLYALLTKLAEHELRSPLTEEREQLMLFIFNTLLEGQYFPALALAAAISEKHSDPALRNICKRMGESCEPSIIMIWQNARSNALSDLSSSAKRISQLLNLKIAPYAFCEALLAEFKDLPLSSSDDPRYRLLQMLQDSENEQIRLSALWMLADCSGRSNNEDFVAQVKEIAQMAIGASKKHVAADSALIFKHLRETMPNTDKQIHFEKAMEEANQSFIERFSNVQGGLYPGKP